MEEGVKSVTFADEDFFGASVKSALYIVESLEEFNKKNIGKIGFDVSMTVHSIFSEKMDIDEITQRKDFLFRLKLCGLKKVFLGIESASRTQLKRYAKGHKKEDIIEAICMLRSCGVRIEIGWIPFDPLCTMDEIQENFEFLIENDLAKETSYIFNQLRLQTKTDYMRVLDSDERKTERKLYSSDFNKNTLSYSYTYKSNSVSNLIKRINKWGERIYPIQYPLKTLCRFGSDGALGKENDTARLILEKFRIALCYMTINIVASQKDKKDYLKELDRECNNLLVDFSQSVYILTSRCCESGENSEILINLKKSAASELKSIK